MSEILEVEIFVRRRHHQHGEPIGKPGRCKIQVEAKRAIGEAYRGLIAGEIEDAVRKVLREHHLSD